MDTTVEQREAIMRLILAAIGFKAFLPSYVSYSGESVSPDDPGSWKSFQKDREVASEWYQDHVDAHSRGIIPTATKYLLWRSPNTGSTTVYLEARDFEGTTVTKWAITDGFGVLSKDGQWEWEPQPSSRTEEFLARTRFDTIEAALSVFEALARKEGLIK